MAVTTIFSGGTPPKEIGADTNGTASNDPGKVRFAKVLVNGDLVVDVDARPVPIGTVIIRDPLGNNFELTGTAVIISDSTGVEFTNRKSMARTANVLNYDNDGSDQPITGIFVIGQGEGIDQASVYVQNTRGKVPLYEDNMSIKDQLDEAVLTQMGSLQLSANSTASSGYTLELDPNLDPKYEDIEVGQLIRLVINHGFTQEDGYFVIGKIKNNPTKQGQDKVTLELFPALDLRLSTSAIINKLTDAQILFFSDMEVTTGLTDTRELPEWTAGNPGGGTNLDGSPDLHFWYPNVNAGDSPYQSADYHFLQESTAVSGRYVAKTQIFDAYNASGNAAQIWRLLNKNGGTLPDTAYYSWWVMYPQQIHYDHFALSRFGFTNHFQLYQKLPSNQPLCTMAAGFDNTNDTTFRWYFNVDCISAFDLTQVGGIHHVVPTETWMHVECRWVRSGTGTGSWQVWVDGVQILNYSGQTANLATTQHGCSWGNYGTLLSPTNPIIYYDDCLISTRSVHDLIFT